MIEKSLTLQGTLNRGFLTIRREIIDRSYTPLKRKIAFTLSCLALSVIASLFIVGSATTLTATHVVTLYVLGSAALTSIISAIYLYAKLRKKLGQEVSLAQLDKTSFPNLRGKILRSKDELNKQCLAKKTTVQLIKLWNAHTGCSIARREEFLLNRYKHALSVDISLSDLERIVWAIDAYVIEREENPNL